MYTSMRKGWRGEHIKQLEGWSNSMISQCAVRGYLTWMGGEERMYWWV